jgi:hypothetical protein
MAVMEPEHNDQFQIGDEVLYTPEGVITSITGYDWLQSVDAPPKIMAYQLACGISAPKNLLALYVGDAPWQITHPSSNGPRHYREPPPQRAPVDAIGKDRMPHFTYAGPRCGLD